MDKGNGMTHEELERLNLEWHRAIPRGPEAAGEAAKAYFDALWAMKKSIKVPVNTATEKKIEIEVADDLKVDG
jgi:hypothetical protein